VTWIVNRRNALTQEHYDRFHMLSLDVTANRFRSEMGFHQRFRNSPYLDFSQSSYHY